MGVKEVMAFVKIMYEYHKVFQLTVGEDPDPLDPPMLHLEYISFGRILYIRAMTFKINNQGILVFICT